jgi:micrococcal nuclease
MNRCRPVGAAVLALATWLLGCTDDSSPDATPDVTAAPPSESAESVTVASVADGDSFEVSTADGARERVRMIGVNAPESGECLADEAREALRDLLDSGEVLLERDVTDRDQFGRLLRYVFADGVFVNQEVVSRGLALAGTFPPDVARQAELDAAEDAAQAASAGQWDPEACGRPASTAVEIVEVHGDAPGPDDENLNGERIVIRNGGDDPVDLSGWVLRDSSSDNRFAFPSGFELGADTRVTVHTGSGPDSDDALYWGADRPIWDNDGDTAFLLDPNGNTVSFADLPPAD